MSFPQIYHVGFMKTGTTTIQKVLDSDDRINLIYHSRFFNTNNFYSQEYSFYDNSLINIESDENIIRAYGNMYGFHTSIQRIKEKVDNPKIIVTIREQKSLLISAYKHHIRQTIDHFTFDEFLNNNVGISFLNSINYANLYDELFKLFPRQDIYFYLYENLKLDYLSFFNNLYLDVLGVPPPKLTESLIENKGMGEKDLLLKLKYNALKKLKKKSIFSKMEHTLLSQFLKISQSNKRYILEWPKTIIGDNLAQEFVYNNKLFAENTGIKLPKEYLL